MVFLDEARIRVIGGRGGNGCVAFRREKFIPLGGPSGGDGGHGGSVYLVGDPNHNTLQHLRFRKRIAAQRGRHGEGSNRTGRTGEDQEILVPLGTIVYDHENDEMVGEILTEDDRLCVAEGGRGGKGNARFSTSTRRAPRYAEPGGDGAERELRLELKLLADVGLVGLPNAGKSTLISTISAARPKIADYPFTTIVPQLGVVAEDRLASPFVIADLPGLIEGASEGSGLGHQFLRHVERCRVLVHMVDLSGLGLEPDDFGNAAEELKTLEDEIEAFNPDLLKRSRLVVGTKVDSVIEQRRESLQAAAKERDLLYLEISSAAHQGLDVFIHELRRRLEGREEDDQR